MKENASSMVPQVAATIFSDSRVPIETPANKSSLSNSISQCEVCGLYCNGAGERLEPQPRLGSGIGLPEICECVVCRENPENAAACAWRRQTTPRKGIVTPRPIKPCTCNRAFSEPPEIEFPVHCGPDKKGMTP
jgi:hypothetical protein